MSLELNLFRFVERVPFLKDQELRNFLQDFVFAAYQDILNTNLKFAWGTTTLASGTGAASFGRDLGTADYLIAFGTDTPGETFEWASKTATGFTINSSNGASTAVVNWIVRVNDNG